MGTKRILYITDYCLTPGQRVNKAGILCEADTILAVGGLSAFTNDDDVTGVDLRGCYAVPGFIDNHIHGAGGFDSSTAAAGANIEEMAVFLARHGVTSFVPTMVAEPIPSMLENLRSLVGMADAAKAGAVAVGIHLEGPFLSQGKRGSQVAENLLPVDMGVARELLAAGGGMVKTWTLAPELPGSVELIEFMLENGVAPSMGHSEAGEVEVLRAIDAGARRCTHLFNGMPPLHQRTVNLTAVALTDDRVTIELILDGTHLHPRMVDLACKLKPKDKIIGISDAIQGAGMRDGLYHIGDAEVSVTNGQAHTCDGRLAGTTMTLEVGWRHLASYSNLAATEATSCFTLNPARDIGLADRGEITPGKKADIAFFNSGDNSVRLVLRDGKELYDSEKQ